MCLVIVCGTVQCILFQQLQIKAIEENKVSKKAKCGVISFVHNFEACECFFVVDIKCFKAKEYLMII